jgi:hypothetical protein
VRDMSEVLAVTFSAPRLVLRRGGSMPILIRRILFVLDGMPGRDCGALDVKRLSTNR